MLTERAIMIAKMRSLPRRSGKGCETSISENIVLPRQILFAPPSTENDVLTEGRRVRAEVPKILFDYY